MSEKGKSLTAYYSKLRDLKTRLFINLILKSKGLEGKFLSCLQQALEVSIQ